MATSRRKCHYCWESGHNVRTCPMVRNNASDPNSSGYHYANNILANRSLKKEIQGGIKCSFCKQTGHNVATCTAKKEQNTVRLAAAAKAFRLKFIDWCKENSFGVGSMISSKNHHSYGIVIGLEPKNIHQYSSNLNSINVHWADGRKYPLELPRKLFSKTFPDSSDSFNIESACGNFNKYFTDDFKNCHDLDLNYI